MFTSKKILSVALVLVSILTIGVIGYMAIERWSFLDALFMTVITVATVGYGEVHPLSSTGRVFTIFLIIGTSGGLLYVISTMTAFVVEGHLKDILRRKKMQNAIDQLNGHYIICGAGVTGWFVIEEMIKTKQAFVVVEKEESRVKELKRRGIRYVEGDSTLDEVLTKGGVNRAKGLVTALGSDRDNLFVVLTARELNPNLRIVAEGIEKETEPKLRKAGANVVVLPNAIGGMRMASEMIRPAVVSFLDLMLREKNQTLRVENVTICSGSSLAGKTVKELRTGEKYDILLLALGRMGSEDFQFNPPQETVLRENNILVVMGNIEKVNEFRKLYECN